jgi:predicted nucleotidyltransferase
MRCLGIKTDMRLSESIRDVIREHISRIAPDAECYLFGSRAIDGARGGDIDLLLLTSKKLPLSLIRGVRRGILNVIGEQQLDIVNCPYASTHPFKDAALEHALRL